MNYLGHAFFSYENSKWLLGNVMTDYIKGELRHKVAHPEIKKGIAIHRKIDAFTDLHWLVKDIKNELRPYYRLYSSPIADILLDYLIANCTLAFKNENDLLNFSFKTYALLAKEDAYFLGNFPIAFESMRTHNWLYNYRLVAGIEKSLIGLKKRAKNDIDGKPAIELLIKNEQKWQEDFKIFFKDLDVELREMLFANTDTK